MAGKTIVVGAFEAKTRLSELLRETERGASVVIRRRGKVVAWLVPPPRHEPWNPHQIQSEFRRIRQRVSGSVRIRDLVEEGRRS